MLFAIENLPYWIFLGTGALLFGIVIVSGGGDDADADVDFDADLDADLDADFDTDLDADLESGLETDGSATAKETAFDGDGAARLPGPVTAVLSWFGLGKAPLILLMALDLCLWGLLGWMANAALGGILGAALTKALGLPILLGSMAIALTLGGQAARPIGKVFAAFGESASGDRLVGCPGVVSSARLYALSNAKIAQVDVLDPAKNRVTVNAALPNWATVHPKIGHKVLVIERLDVPPLYLVIAKDSADEAQWFAAVK
ncbi:MAG: DUF1449 domain-containing protein [Elainellaceae cyanobacterium]